ncbi:DUF4265 domain-containing protein [Pseudomonas sp. SBB6]|uniref:DUF4265 domain-containing protein n=1 Tax=Pseudomonas sp. SBB6 TaxID=2962032 RepID=UPI0020B889CA|nr:DUF4265 domain-containing protein [Pseudomonas sp. SBB6]MCP3750102.1 DUF4265 domain-containing protein [Pseudomonas sp. SBB6]
MDCQHSAHIRIFVDSRSNGDPVFESVPVRQIDANTFELLSSPGLALDLARGDTIRINHPDQRAEVLQRGGNFCIHIYADDLPQEAVDTLQDEVQTLLGGTLDGRYKGNLTLAIPARNGFAAIREVFDRFRQCTGVEWYYANIYRNLDDDEDETLLDWWLDS